MRYSILLFCVLLSSCVDIQPVEWMGDCILVISPSKENKYKIQFDISLKTDEEINSIEDFNGYFTIKNCVVKHDYDPSVTTSSWSLTKLSSQNGYSLFSVSNSFNPKYLKYDSVSFYIERKDFDKELHAYYAKESGHYFDKN